MPRGYKAKPGNSQETNSDEDATGKQRKGKGKTKAESSTKATDAAMVSPKTNKILPVDERDCGSSDRETSPSQEDKTSKRMKFVNERTDTINAGDLLSDDEEAIVMNSRSSQSEEGLASGNLNNKTLNEQVSQQEVIKLMYAKMRGEVQIPTDQLLAIRDSAELNRGINGSKGDRIGRTDKRNHST